MRRRRSVLAAMVLLAGSVIVAPVSASAEDSRSTVTLRGTVTDATTGVAFPQPGYIYIVDVFETTTLARYRTIASDPTGAYTISGIPPGTYRARVRVFGSNPDPTFIEGYQWHAAAAPATTFEGGADIVLDLATPPIIDFAVTPIAGGAAVTGTLTDKRTAAPVFGECYGVWTFEAGSGIGTGVIAIPDASGYTVGQLPPGDYKALATESYGLAVPCDATAPAYLDRWFGGGTGSLFWADLGADRLDNPPLIGTASVVTLGAGTTTLDFALAPTPTCDGLAPTIIGTSQSDTLVGTAGPDVIVGLAGNDIILGLDGDDALCGNGGGDTLHGGPDADYVKGGRGSDDLRGGSEDDELRGGRGHDVIRGNSGDDEIRAGGGDDTVLAGLGDDTVFAGAGDDDVRGNPGDDLLFGNSGADTLRGGPDTDVANGGPDIDWCLAETELGCES